MITLTREEAQQVLDALQLECTDADGKPVDLITPAIETLRARLSAPEPEPVAYIQADQLEKAKRAPFLCRVEPTQRLADFLPIYTAPPQREWQGLTDEEITLIGVTHQSLHQVARAIEAMLREKNT